ncbi:MAG: hypothetical protein BWY45_02504 [Euryarchaeota archaeon ADurb.Bin294]|nr:MAG: hypothetical protein BWY45_02504 [Euryarchaeota archaeon ADurb.Bin294]
MTARFVQYLDLSEPDARVLSLMNPEKRHLITDDFTLSPSSLQTYESCPLRFEFGYVIRIPTMDALFFPRGTGVDTVLEMAEGKGGEVERIVSMLYE